MGDWMAFDGLGDYDLQEDADDLALRFEDKETKRIQDILDAFAHDEPALIDALCVAYGWFGPVFDENSYQTIKEFIEGDEVLPEQAATRIAAPIEVHASAGDVEEAGRWLLDLWNGFLHAAKRTPAARQGKLVQLLKLLQARPDPPGVPIWSDLWGFDGVASEASNDTPSRSTRSIPMAEIHAHTNLSSFMAQLTLDGLAAHWYWNAREALYDGLEVANAASDLDTFVPAAAAWIRVFGARLKSDESIKTGSIPHTYSRGTGWDFWKDRLKDIGRHPGANEETKRIATETAALMDELDG